MGREIFFLHFGQAGIQIGSALWELLCYEHAVDSTGCRQDDDVLSQDTPANEHLDTMFCEGKNKFSPRAILVDLEPTVVDEIRTGAYRKLWRPGSLISGKEDAANNYGRGYYTIGRTKLDNTMEAIRRVAEDANNLAAFNIMSSNSGGTGSGMSSLVLEHLLDEYGKKFRFSGSVFPSSMYSQSTVDPYNTILHTSAALDALDCDILFDNQTLYERFTRTMGISHPSFTSINRLLAQMLSSVFLAHRFVYQGSQHADTTEMLTNLIPYPRIHFPAMSYAPIQTSVQIDTTPQSVRELTKAVFSQDAQTLDFPCSQNAYISCVMLYRGLTSPRPVYDALQNVKSNSKTGTTFVDWCPTGFKIGLNTYPQATFPDSPLGSTDMAVCMLAGNLGMHEAWHRNNMKFDLLFSHKSFIHWYVGEGVEEGEFIEARENVATLEQDYLDLMNEVAPVGKSSSNAATRQENENNFLTKPGLHHQPKANPMVIKSIVRNRNDEGDKQNRRTGSIVIGSSRNEYPTVAQGDHDVQHRVINAEYPSIDSQRKNMKRLVPSSMSQLSGNLPASRGDRHEGVPIHRESMLPSPAHTNYSITTSTSNHVQVKDKNMNNPRMWDQDDQFDVYSTTSETTNYSIQSSEHQFPADQSSLKDVVGLSNRSGRTGCKHRRSLVHGVESFDEHSNKATSSAFHSITPVSRSYLDAEAEGDEEEADCDHTVSVTNITRLSRQSNEIMTSQPLFSHDFSPTSDTQRNSHRLHRSSHHQHHHHHDHHTKIGHRQHNLGELVLGSESKLGSSMGKHTRKHHSHHHKHSHNSRKSSSTNEYNSHSQAQDILIDDIEYTNNEQPDAFTRVKCGGNITPLLSVVSVETTD